MIGIAAADIAQPAARREPLTNDDFYSVQSSVSLDLSEGEAVQILIHGYYAEGEYTLDINPCSE